MKLAFKTKSAFGTSIIILSVLLVIFLVSAVATFLYLNENVVNDKEYIRVAGEQRFLAQRLTSIANQMVLGDFSNISNLQKIRTDYQANMKYLRNGNPDIGLPPSPESVADRMEDLDKLWKIIERNFNAIIDASAAIKEIQAFIDNINLSIPDLQALSEQLNIILATNNAPANQIYLSTQQELLLSHLMLNANRLMQDSRSTSDSARQFSSDFEQFGKVLTAMQNGDKAMNINRVTQTQAQAILVDLNNAYQALNNQTQNIINQIPLIVEAQRAAQNLKESSPDLVTTAAILMNSYSQLRDTRLIRDYTGIILGAAALLTVVWLGFKIQNETKRRLVQAAQQNQRNQDAIMRLLDEICDLANGDLTTEATVTEDITGAIADAINYTVEQLRMLVTSINEITVQVSSAAKSTQATALHLAEASEQQARQIRAVTDATNQMALSIDSVSDNSNESSDVANKSMQIAKTGASAVQDTIRGMDTIREQIQETSKRIKRLGESSQEIGDMVDLINDIADQTNILALNAAIQAAMAGKSGRGFAVVADEVQRLAEKSTDATTQIENLVRTIQSDTNEAVASMEQTITQVVTGAKLALNAGESLTEIENVSTHLAELTQSISHSAQQQAKVAASISESMNVIQNVTTQTAAGTSNTSTSIGVLAELSNQLRKSVSGFKLPGK